MRKNFGFYLSKYFKHHLIGLKGCSPRTIDSYRQAFKLLLEYFEKEKGKIPTTIVLDDINQVNIENFLLWLEKTKKNSPSSRNARQAAINSFVKFLIKEIPDRIEILQSVLSIPIKKVEQQKISYLGFDGIKALLNSVDQKSKQCFRNYVILFFMVATGVRVSEIINLSVSDINLGNPATVLVHGKGFKSRYIPLPKNLVKVLNKYFDCFGLRATQSQSRPLFVNHSNERLTRQGITYLVKKYATIARQKNPNFVPCSISPHSLRHSCAMLLLEQGVDLIYIHDILGHESITTTEVYAKAYSNMKRQAIEVASSKIVPQENALWEEDKKLKEWLDNLTKAKIMERIDN